MPLSVARSATRRSYAAALFAAAMGLGQVVLLARLVSKTDLALVALSGVWASLATHLQEGGVNAAIVQRPENPPLVLSTLYWFNLLQGIVLWGLVALSGWGMAHIYGTPELVFLTAAYALVLVPGGASLQYKALLQKNFRFRELARIEICGALTSFAIIISLAWQGWGAWALVWGYLARQGVESSLQIAAGSRFFRPALVWQPIAAAPWFKTGFSHIGERLTTHFAGQLDTLLIGKFWGTEALGVYDTFRRIIFRPVALVSGAAEQVAFPLLSKLQFRPLYFRKAYLMVMNGLNTLIFPGYALAILLAPSLVPMVFGESWTIYTPVFQWICVSAMLGALLNPIDSLLLAKGKIHLWQRAGLLLAALTAIALGAVSDQGIASAAAALVVAQGLLCILVFTQMLPRQLGAGAVDYAKAVGIPLLCSATALTPLFFLYQHPPGIPEVFGFLFFILLYIMTTRQWNRLAYNWIWSVIKGGS